MILVIDFNNYILEIIVINNLIISKFMHFL